MYTYFLKTNVNSLVKIGKAINVETRIKQLRGALTFMELSVFHVLNGDYERDFHKLYKEYRHSGEWFDIPNLTVEQIENFATSVSKSREPALPVGVFLLPPKKQQSELAAHIRTLFKNLNAGFSIASLLNAIKELHPNAEGDDLNIAEYENQELLNVFYETREFGIYADKEIRLIINKTLYGNSEFAITFRTTNYRNVILIRQDGEIVDQEEEIGEFEDHIIRNPCRKQ